MAGRYSLDEGYAARYIGNFCSTPIVFNVGESTTNSHPAALAAGVYAIWSNCKTFVRQVAANTITVTAANGIPISIESPTEFAVSGSGDTYIVALAHADDASHGHASGTLWISKR